MGATTRSPAACRYVIWSVWFAGGCQVARGASVRGSRAARQTVEALASAQSAMEVRRCLPAPAASSSSSSQKKGDLGTGCEEGARLAPSGPAVSALRVLPLSRWSVEA